MITFFNKNVWKVKNARTRGTAWCYCLKSRLNLQKFASGCFEDYYADLYQMSPAAMGRIDWRRTDQRQKDGLQYSPEDMVSSAATCPGFASWLGQTCHMVPACVPHGFLC